MSEPLRSDQRSSETRLLIATIVISVIVLVVLARFRFPEATAHDAAPPAAAPLERLAASATYDELAAIMADLEQRLRPRLAVVRVLPERASGPFTVAPRLTANRAVALIGPGETLGDDGPAVVNRDQLRGIAVVAVPEAADAAVTPRPGTAGRPGPRYVAVVEATADGPVIRPVYVARTDTLQDPRTNSPLLSMRASGQALPKGAAVFSLTGIFIGIVSEAGASATVIPAESLKAAAESEQTGPELRGDLAVEIQPLSPALAKVAGTDQGVMISYVHPQGPSAGALESGDVITSVDGSTVTTPEGFLDLARSRTPGSAVRIQGVRRGKPLDVGIMARDAAGAPLAPAAADAGMTLRAADGLGAELIAVRPHGAAASAGLAAGDIVVRLDGRDAPVVSDILRAYRALAPGRALLLTVQRGSGHQVVALEKR